MGNIFDFTLMDLWNHPAIRLLRGGAKLGARAIASANAKAKNYELAPAELMDMRQYASAGDSDAQVVLALHYMENQELETAVYWLIQSAKQGNEKALGIIEMLQEG